MYVFFIFGISKIYKAIIMKHILSEAHPVSLQKLKKSYIYGGHQDKLRIFLKLTLYILKIFIQLLRVL